MNRFLLSKRTRNMRSIWINPEDGAVIEVPGETHEETFRNHPELFSNAISEDDMKAIVEHDVKRSYKILEYLYSTWPRITSYGNYLGVDVPSKSNIFLHYIQNILMTERMRGKISIKFNLGDYLDNVCMEDFVTANKWDDILKPHRSFHFSSNKQIYLSKRVGHVNLKNNFILSKRAQELEPITPNPHIVIEPYEPAIEKALAKIPSNIKMNVTKVVVHSGGGSGHLGHVEMGQGKDPREIHIYKDRIRSQVQQMFGTAQPTPQQLEQAMERALMETILHEAGHIGPARTQEQILQGPFFGETEAENFAKQHMPTASFEKAMVKAACDLEDIREKFLPNYPVGEPDLAFVANSMNDKKYYLVKSGVRLLTSGTLNPVTFEVKAAAKFNKSIVYGKKVAKLLGSISRSVGALPHEELNFAIAVAKWQDKNRLSITGKLDRETLFKFSQDSSNLPKNFGVVVPNFLYRGAMIESKEQLAALKVLGVKRVVSLHNHPDIARMCEDLGLEHVAAPIETGAPEDYGRKILGDSVSRFFSTKPTYIHCFYGKDRTGGVIARFRTEIGWPCKTAYAEAKAYGFQDVFVDLIDWFSEGCEPPINTGKIRSLMKKTPYENPENIKRAFEFEDRTTEDDKPEKPKTDIYKKHDDPVKHVREDNPKMVLPHNIPDMQVVQKGLESPQKMKITNEGIEPGNPNGPYFLLDVQGNEMERYNTKEEAIKNAGESKWAYEVIYSTYGDPETAIIYDQDSIVWTKPVEYLRKLEEENPIGPFYLIDYWGRVVMSYENKDQAIKNAESNMYIELITYSPMGNYNDGDTIWEKPLEKTRIQNLSDGLNPVPSDMLFGNPYQDASEHAYTTWSDTINGVSPTGIFSMPLALGGTEYA